MVMTNKIFEKELNARLINVGMTPKNIEEDITIESLIMNVETELEETVSDFLNESGIQGDVMTHTVSSDEGTISLIEVKDEIVAVILLDESKLIINEAVYHI